MSVVNLKDEKRINVNGEYDLVTTHPNNEPIYRSNGHQLGLNSSNSDYLGLNTEVSFTGDFFIEFDVDSKLNSNTQVLGINENGQTNISLFGGGKIFYNTDGQSFYLSASGVLPFTGRFKYKIERVGVNTFFYVNGVQVDAVNNQNGTFTLNRLFGSFTSFFDGDVYSININGESFNPTNINSSAQIEGSSGTIAQVNSSAADPINYILGDVFQKSGFALEFDSANGEYVEVDENITLTTTADIDLEISFIPNTFDGNNQFLFNKGINGNSSNSSYYIRRFNNNSSGVYNFNINDNLGVFSQNIVLNQTLIIDNEVNTITIKNRVITVNGVANANLIGISPININDTQNALVGCFNDFDDFWDGSIIHFKYQGDNYPLRRGLGNKILKEGAEAFTALELVATNSDFISAQFSNTTITETSDIDLEFQFYLDSFDGGRIRLFHFSDENGEGVNNNKSFWFETSTPRDQLLFRQSNSDGSVTANAKDLGSPIIGVNSVKILNGEAFLNGVKTSSDPNNYTLDISNPYLKIARFYIGSQYTDVTLLGFKFQGESFSVQEINSSAQIIGSEGSVAQANTSAAGGTSYILDNIVTPNEATIISGSADADRINFGMWQKNGNVLNLNADNGEYLLLPSVQTLSADGDYLEIDFKLDSLGQQFAIVSEGNTGDYLTILSDGRLFINTGSGNSLSTLVINDLDNVVRIERTATGLDVTLNGVTETSTLTTDFNFGQFFRRASGYLSGRINYIKSTNESYLFREGYGNLTTAEGRDADLRVLKLVATNSDYVELDSDYQMSVSDSIEFDFTMLSSDSYPLGVNTSSDQHIRVLTSDIRIKVVSGDTIVFPVTNTVGERMQVKVVRSATDYEIFKNGVSLGTQSSSNQLVINAFNSRSNNSSFRKDMVLNGSIKLGSETFSVQEINASAQIVGSEGTIAQVNTSAAGGTSYILDNVYNPYQAEIKTSSSDADYIDAEVWDVDSNKWIDYEKE